MIQHPEISRLIATGEPLFDSPYAPTCEPITGYTINIMAGAVNLTESGKDAVLRELQELLNNSDNPILRDCNFVVEDIDAVKTTF